MSTKNGKMHATRASATTPATSTPTIKREPSGSPLLTNGIGKLSSLTPARDLTLGGRGGLTASAAKKVYMPNLNVVRNKNATVKTSKDTTARGRGRGGRPERGAGRGAARGGRGGANSSLIQTTGVFSEGAGAVVVRKGTSSSGYGRESDDTPTAMRKPTLPKSERKVDLKADAAHVRELLGDSDEDDFVDDDKTDLEHIPIQLSEAKWKYVKSEIKSEPCDIKLDVDETDDDAVAIAQQIQTLHVAQQQKLLGPPNALPRFPQTVPELLQSSQPQIFLMQLPDTLPCVDGDDDDSPESTASNADPKTAAPDAPSIQPAFVSTSSRPHLLKKMEEGQVGRLLRYKSGKIKLVLGETYFNLDMGMETGFLQDLMSISTNREERSGNMINLGPIQAKITATPDWEHLLKHANEEQA